ncbi:MAG: hypothetical protein H0X70_03385 [Segetibacter sp.]|jgi:Tol biopolymer transport system component|nr:hypothetical protein [Segetibacter sp.]
MKTFDFIPLTTTRAWNFQEGCMAHWLQNSSEQKIYLMDMKTQEVKLLGSSAEPKEYTEKGGQWRCDIHSRWSPKGDMIGFNSTKTGERQAYIYRVKE